ncbi:GGDEF domain-containing protein [Sulfurimonas marina]|uniref:diguanylate cyclase n=1 Tax=Sulfurimonas marina TaxID=2590551 RepID=A0A7M1AW74_9BACT|nr:GGDEF domain-containing protein [Sulfurimonas marina]QOP40622.1 diguanylate cyclase [Sulfurimonas marina]
MKFPSAGDIASTQVVSININEPISKAIDMMIVSDHRDIIVQDYDLFYVLTAIEVLKLRESSIKLIDPISHLTLKRTPAVKKDTNVLNLLRFLDELTEYICVINEDRTIYGLITHTDITSNIDPEIIMDNYTIEDFLRLTRRVRWINKEMSTSDVLSHMYTGENDSVIIVEEQKPIGILTTKDVVQLIKHNADLDLPIKAYMNSPVESIHKRTSIREALEFVKAKHYKRLIVVDDEGRLSGIITQKELILLTYNRWALVMKEHQEELQEINSILKAQNQEYELLASIDPLTKLYNRYKFKQLFNSSLETMLQRAGVMSLVLLDIDFFKKVNDQYGHNVGDDVLQKISELLKNETREVDIVCRWGGEEFTILFPTVDLEQACTIAEKIRGKIEQLEIDKVGHVTASFGVAEVSGKVFLEDVVAKADDALYKAKSSGRNKVMW